MKNWKDILALCSALLILVSLVVAAVLDQNSVPAKETTQVNSSISSKQNVKPIEPTNSDKVSSIMEDWDYYRGKRVYEALIDEPAAIEDLDEEHINLLIGYLNENPRLVDELKDMYSSEVEEDSYSSFDRYDPVQVERETEQTNLFEEPLMPEEELYKTEEPFNYHHSVDTSTNNDSIGRLTSNPYAGYDNPYDPDSINNPYGKYGSPYSPNSANNPYATDTPELYDSEGNYRGKLSSNPYDPDSISNPYGQYGSPYSSDSINNPYGAGSPYRYDSPNNPYGSGWTIIGTDE